MFHNVKPRHLRRDRSVSQRHCDESWYYIVQNRRDRRRAKRELRAELAS